jgi:hypothetical protein
LSDANAVKSGEPSRHPTREKLCRRRPILVHQYGGRTDPWVLGHQATEAADVTSYVGRGGSDLPVAHARSKAVFVPGHSIEDHVMSRSELQERGHVKRRSARDIVVRGQAWTDYLGRTIH